MVVKHTSKENVLQAQTVALSGWHQYDRLTQLGFLATHNLQAHKTTLKIGADHSLTSELSFRGTAEVDTSTAK